jgi:Asp-tRNA(Asn)/Glu-tRNA(Gln) amidotransferase A subunit family amidase
MVKRLVSRGLSARRIASDIVQGRLTAEAALRACLERIEAVEPDIQAWQWLDPEAALAAARALDLGPSRGVLHGVPLGVKDVFDTYDMPTAYGSAVYAGHRPARDAACVATVRAKGALILGKTVSTEFAFSAPAKTRKASRATDRACDHPSSAENNRELSCWAVSLFGLLAIGNLCSGYTSDR